jgi:superfamily I DNA/RNA helicase
MVDPETNSLLVLYDNAQSIYSKGNGLQFRLSDAGIQARGRTRVLKINYRNTAEVLAVACEFAREMFAAGEDEIIPVMQPESLRHGALPELVKLPSFAAEADYIAGELQALNDNGLAWNDMAVLYRDRRRGEILEQRLRAAGIPLEWLNKTRHSRHYQPAAASVKVMTMHSSKGLEFPVVAVAGLGLMPYRNADPQDEARLLYVAMTRAMDTLLLTYDRDSEFTERMRAARQRVAA